MSIINQEQPNELRSVIAKLEFNVLDEYHTYGQSSNFEVSTIAYTQNFEGNFMSNSFTENDDGRFDYEDDDDDERHGMKKSVCASDDSDNQAIAQKSNYTHIFEIFNRSSVFEDNSIALIELNDVFTNNNLFDFSSIGSSQETLDTINVVETSEQGDINNDITTEGDNDDDDDNNNDGVALFMEQKEQKREDYLFEKEK